MSPLKSFPHPVAGIFNVQPENFFAFLRSAFQKSHDLFVLIQGFPAKRIGSGKEKSSFSCLAR